MRDILISENIAGAGIDDLCSRFNVLRLPELWKDVPALAEHIRNTRALIVRNQTRVTGQLLRDGNELMVVARAGAGLDNIDMQAAIKAGVVVTYTPDQNSISAAELTIALMLALVRKIPEANLDTRAGGWNRQRFVGMELFGKTLGIIGAGKIGYLTAKRAQAFGMKILAYDPFLSADNIYLSELNAELVDLDQLLARADVVSCHVPGTPQTTGLLNRQRFAKMKPTAYLINTSRGEVIEERDLIDALKSGMMAGAAVDVRASEPPRSGELELMPNVILTPHIAAFTNEAQDRVIRAVCDDVARVLEGKPATNAATPFNVPHTSVAV
ncbi:MAG TPA: hydroxyacid dehydrogenase [Terriglobales bacterium]